MSVENRGNKYLGRFMKFYPVGNVIYQQDNLLFFLRHFFFWMFCSFSSDVSFVQWSSDSLAGYLYSPEKRELKAFPSPNFGRFFLASLSDQMKNICQFYELVQMKRLMLVDTELHKYHMSYQETCGPDTLNMFHLVYLRS